MSSSSATTEAPRAATCALAGHAFLSVPAEQIAALRKQPGPVWGEPLAANFLRHADEQTVVGLAAVYQAIHDHDLARDAGPSPFAGWGVVVAPRFVGRAAMAQLLPRFLKEGAWGVSPHLIPHRSLHSPSGTLSIALKIHGPNFGAGGGPDCAAEAVLAALALLEGMQLPGIWLVLSQVEPEGDADTETGQPSSTAVCQALALALVPADGGSALPCLDIVPGQAGEPILTLNDLAVALAGTNATLSLGRAGRLVVRRRHAALPRPHLARHPAAQSLSSV